MNVQLFIKCFLAYSSLCAPISYIDNVAQWPNVTELQVEFKFDYKAWRSQLSNLIDLARAILFGQ
jgi:hypothetical protein